MVERIRLIASNILEDQMTLTDPVTMVRPWVVTRYFHQREGKVVHESLTDRPCTTNVVMNKQGFQVLLLPQEVDAAGGNVTAAGEAAKGVVEGGVAGAGGVTDPGVTAGSADAAGSPDAAPAGNSQTNGANPGRTR
jgi:hypothetical protein